MNNEWITIKDAAQALGVAEKTIRRRIQKGDIQAELRDSPYGQQYFIPRHQINTAQQIIDVVQVKKEYSVQELALALSEYMDRRETVLMDAIKDLKGSVDNLKLENDNLQKKLQEQQETHLRAIDEQLTRWKAELGQEKKQKGFFSIFKKSK